MKTLCIANQKGGVGKTTTAVNLAAGLAETGARVLLVDLDAQCNATYCLQSEQADSDDNINEVLLDERDISSIVRRTTVESLDVAPAGESLASAELNLASMIGRDSACARSWPATGRRPTTTSSWTRGRTWAC